MATKYVESFERSGVLITKKIKEIPDEKQIDYKKGLARKKIEEEVFDIQDSVADNAKMISLLTSVVRTLWEIIPDENKKVLPDDAKQAIEYVMGKFKETTTWADIKWAQEGIGFADKLLERQGNIGKIIKEVYGS